MNRVYLVGGGPGDPDLLTVKALLLLRNAQVVLHDALISREILELINPSAMVVDVGKSCSHKLLTQDEINSLLVHHARRSKVVVRLKSGDPTIFGRAGEEIEALRAAELSYEIVPGITSALAGAAAAGISLTDRRYASSVVFATAHRGTGADAVEWDRLVMSRSTLVIYMPGRDYKGLANQLISAGLDPSTPCAVISCAGRPNQNVLQGSLRTLEHSSSTVSPSLVIVGRCAGELNSVEDLCRIGNSQGNHFALHHQEEHV